MPPPGGTTSRTTISPCSRRQSWLADSPTELACADCLENAPAELHDQLLQLRVDVAPLTHAIEGEEMLPAGLVQPAAGFPLRERFLEKIPELDPGKEIGLLVVEAFLRLVGGGSALARPLAWVLHRESRGDDEHLAQRVLGFRCENHAADARVDRHPRELFSCFGQLVRFVHGTQ